MKNKEKEQDEVFADICTGVQISANLLAAASDLSYRQVMAMIISALVLDLGGVISTDD